MRDFKSYVPYIILSLLALGSTSLLWLPFILRVSSINGVSIPDINFYTIAKHWDGLLYIIPAKTWYDPSHPIMQARPLGLSPEYFAAHLPLYPATIALLAPIIGYIYGMLTSTLIATVGLVSIFYFICKKYALTKYPLVLSAVMLFVTPRFFLVRSVGSSEPLFMLLILAATYLLVEKKYVWSAVLLAFSIATRSPAVLILGGFGLFGLFEMIKTKKVNFSYSWFALVPLALLTIFYFYAKQYSDFFVYFKGNENAHFSYPFAVFNFTDKWVTTAWIEEIVFYYALYLVAAVALLPFMRSNNDSGKERFLGISSGVLFVYGTVLLSVFHRDIARYSIPLLPFAMIAFEKFLTSKKFLYVLPILIVALYFYSWNFMLYNIASVGDWSIFQ